MTTSIGNSKVYHFLARTQRNQDNDWQKYADKKYGNSDGIISYNEFVNFIKSEYSDVMNGDALSNADMNIFWNSVDTDKVEFTHRGNTVKGVNNLNATEFANMDKELEDFIKLEEVCAFAEKQMPSGCFRDTSDEKQWKSIVSNLLVAEFSKWRAEGKKSGDFYTYMTTNNLNRLYEIECEATVRVQKDNVIDDFMKKENWQRLAELGYNIGEDKRIDAQILALVTEYVNANGITDPTEIAQHLPKILAQVEPTILEFLANKVGLDGDGKPVANEDQKTDAKKSLTKEQLLGFTSQLYDMVDEALNSLDFEQQPYRAIYEKYARKYINELIANTEPTWEAFNELMGKTNPKAILNHIMTDPTIQAEIQKEIEIIKLKENVTKWLETVDFGASITDKNLKNVLETNGIVSAIKTEITTNLDTLLEGITTEADAKAKLTEYANKQMLERLSGILEGGYGLNKSDYETTNGYNRTLHADALAGMYDNAVSVVDKSKLTEEEKIAAYAKFASGYFKDIASMGENCAKLVKDKVGVNYSSTALINTAKLGKGLQVIKDMVTAVRNGLAEAIKADEKVEEVDDVDDVDDDDKVDGTDDYDYVSDDTTISSGVHKSHDLKAAKEAAKEEVNKLITKIADDMISEGLNERYVKAAMKSTQEYMTDFVDAVSEKWIEKETKIDITEPFKDGVSWAKQTRANKKNLTMMPTFDIPVVLLENAAINNSYEIKINVEFVASKMEEFYNKAVAGDEEVLKDAPSQEEIDKTRAINEFTYSGEEYVTSGKDSSHSMSIVKNNAIENVRSLIKNIKEAMKAEGLTNKLDDVEKAANAHMKTYINALQDDNFGKGSRNDEGSLDINGEKVSWAKQSRDREKKLDLRPSAAYPVVLLENTMINNSYEILISTEYVVNLMKNLYAKYL